MQSQSGFFTIERTCPACNGAAQIISKPSKSCLGEGRLHQEKTLSIKIPPGVDHGSRIRLSGKGEAGQRGGPPGDLYIFVSMKPHVLFQREGADIHCQVPLQMVTAVLGGSVDVPTIDGGKVRLTIPEGTQSGHNFRRKGRGMSVLNKASHMRGDMYVHVHVETPIYLTGKQKDILRQFGQETGQTQSHPQSDSFFPA